MKITKFEDLECWQAARILANMVYGAVKNSPEFQKDFRLSGQITAAAVSTMSNTAEGFARRSNKEFVQFLFISKSSAAEVQSEAYVSLDQRYISKDEFQKIYEQAEKVSTLNSGLITYLLSHQKQNKHGRKPNSLDKPNKLKQLNQPNEPSDLGGT